MNTANEPTQSRGANPHGSEELPVPVYPEEKTLCLPRRPEKMKTVKERKEK
jgi:hypothetical protein